MPFIWDACCQTPLTTYPPLWGNGPLPKLHVTFVAYLVFQPARFTSAYRHRQRRELLPHAFTLTPTNRGGFLSVALAVSNKSPYQTLPVRKCGVLSCPDFPPRYTGAARRFALYYKGTKLSCNLNQGGPVTELLLVGIFKMGNALFFTQPFLNFSAQSSIAYAMDKRNCGHIQCYGFL